MNVTFPKDHLRILPDGSYDITFSWVSRVTKKLVTVTVHNLVSIVDEAELSPEEQFQVAIQQYIEAHEAGLEIEQHNQLHPALYRLGGTSLTL
jgi:hypothetical protein